MKRKGLAPFVSHRIPIGDGGVLWGLSHGIIPYDDNDMEFTNCFYYVNATNKTNPEVVPLAISIMTHQRIVSYK